MQYAVYDCKGINCTVEAIQRDDSKYYKTVLMPRAELSAGENSRAEVSPSPCCWWLAGRRPG